MKPGAFVRIRLNISPAKKRILVIDRAIQSNQGKKEVFVVGAGNKVERRRVTTGALQEDGMRVISEGLMADDWVVTAALQQVQEGKEITPVPTPMQGFGQPTPTTPPKAK
jgi:multidrug efflux system membrane fusion protein